MQGVRRQGAGALTGARALGLPGRWRTGASRIATRSSRYFTFLSHPGRLAAALVALVLGHAHGAELLVADLADLSLEQLANIEVTSVSRRAERLSEAAASIYVITNDDIRRSGVTSLPEALRLAPNLQVARGNASGYAISARGFNNSAGNKLLVMIDGRSVYTPLFSGVFWDVQDVMLEDIDRIEVISGPGGTLWGTNAVNGIINVITRSAKDTQGGLAAVGGGNREWEAAYRYGGTFGGNGHYRVYGKYFDRDNTSTAVAPRDDAWHKGQAGFRADWGSARDQFTVLGNVYDGSEGQPAPGTIVTGANFALGKISISGANLLTRWGRRLEGGSNLVVQAYYDRTERTVRPTFSETLDIVDVQFQHALQAGMHALAWGAEYRYSWDDVTNSQFVAFLPGKVNQNWASLFAQDEMTLTESLRLTVGARIENNDYTDNEFLPNARLAWKLSPDHLLWTAASRAVRSPSRLDRDTFVPGSPPFQLAGGPDVRSEIAKVYEVGYRGQPAPSISFSVTAFYADYDHLRSQEIALSGTSLFFFFANEIEGRNKGIEMWGAYQAARSWRLSGGLLVQDMDLRLKPGSTDPVGPSALGNDPDYQLQLRSSLDLTARHEFDVIVRRVDELPNPVVRAYTAVDARLGWRVRRDIDVSLTLQNLFDDAHAEFAQITIQSEYKRGVFLKLRWQTL